MSSDFGRISWWGRLGDNSRFEPTKSRADKEYVRSPQKTSATDTLQYMPSSTPSTVLVTLFFFILASSMRSRSGVGGVSERAYTLPLCNLTDVRPITRRGRGEVRLQECGSCFCYAGCFGFWSHARWSQCYWPVVVVTGKIIASTPALSHCIEP